MCNNTLHIASTLSTNQMMVNYDPTRTTSLRNAYAADMKRRFRELARVVRRSVDMNDAFGLKNDINVQQMNPASHNQFNFPLNSDKIKAFRRWFNQQVNLGILTPGTLTGSESWQDKYIFDTYKRGIQRARYEMQKAGFQVPSIEASGGIDIAMTIPIHVNTLQMMYMRNFIELQGITNAMDQQISRILAQGLADGDNPRVLARKMVADINGAGAAELGITDTLGRYIPAERRAMTLARTEVIRTHSEAMLTEYELYGMEGVQVKAEFATSQDDRVCQICSSFEGEIFTLKRAHGFIPVHPNCRCMFLPYNASLTTRNATGQLN